MKLALQIILLFVIGAVGVDAASMGELMKVDILPTLGVKYANRYSNQSNEDLRKDIKSAADNDSEYLIPDIRLELARRGDREERKHLFALLKSSNAGERATAISSMEILADKEAVYHLGEMLNHPDGLVIYDDVVHIAPSDLAARVLSRLIDTPPVEKRRYGYSEEEMQLWRDWWQKVRPQFSEFFPKDETQKD